MEQKKSKSNLVKNILRFAVLLVCGAVLGFNVYLANAKTLGRNQLPMPFGYGAAVVLSGSMEKELSVGDLIIVTEDDAYDVGEVVVFQDGESLVVHRVVAVDGDSVTTKGDANNAEDAPISKELIKGKVLFHIPAVGNVVNFIKTPLGSILIIALAVALLEIPRRREKKKDDEEKQKIIDEINRLKNGISDEEKQDSESATEEITAETVEEIVSDEKSVEESSDETEN